MKSRDYVSLTFIQPKMPQMNFLRCIYGNYFYMFVLPEAVYSILIPNRFTALVRYSNNELKISSEEVSYHHINMTILSTIILLTTNFLLIVNCIP